jgi:hypothetical protein
MKRRAFSETIDERIVEMRRFIDHRYRDIRYIGWDASELRAYAHDALDKLLSGNVVGAEIGIRSLDAQGTADFRRKLDELDLVNPELEYA